MVNVWEYANDLPIVNVIVLDGNSFLGRVVNVIDAEELEENEDYIAVEAESGEIRMFGESEISSIERV